LEEVEREVGEGYGLRKFDSLKPVIILKEVVTLFS